MGIFIGWFILSLIVAILGSSRKIGFGGALFVSVFLSPLIGFIVVLCSQRNSTIEFQKRLLAASEVKEEKKIQSSAHDEIDKILELKSKGIITESEYQRMKDKIINSI